MLPASKQLGPASGQADPLDIAKTVLPQVIPQRQDLRFGLRLTAHALRHAAEQVDCPPHPGAKRCLWFAGRGSGRRRLSAA